MSDLKPITLRIQEPIHGQIFVATGAAATVTVTLRGEIIATAFPSPAALVRKWYSSLVDHPLGTTDQITAALPVGSHIITFTVKDKNEDGVPPAQLANLFKSVEHIGAAGGPPDPPPADGKPCVIHVLIANMLSPAKVPANSPPPSLSKTGAVLEAQAPLQWGKYVKDAPWPFLRTRSGLSCREQAALSLVFSTNQLG